MFTAGTEGPTPTGKVQLADVDGDGDLDMLAFGSANSVKARLNQGPAVAPPVVCAPADTVAVISPAGLALLGCGALPPPLRVSSPRLSSAHGGGAASAATEARSEFLQTMQIPNIFTPGNDQLNDTFERRLAAPRTFHLQVFNRWRREIFSTQQYCDF